MFLKMKQQHNEKNNNKNPQKKRYNSNYENKKIFMRKTNLNFSLIWNGFNWFCGFFRFKKNYFYIAERCNNIVLLLLLPKNWTRYQLNFCDLTIQPLGFIWLVFLFNFKSINDWRMSIFESATWNPFDIWTLWISFEIVCLFDCQLPGRHQFHNIDSVWSYFFWVDSFLDITFSDTWWKSGEMANILSHISYSPFLPLCVCVCVYMFALLWKLKCDFRPAEWFSQT